MKITRSQLKRLIEAAGQGGAVGEYNPAGATMRKSSETEVYQGSTRGKRVALDQGAKIDRIEDMVIEIEKQTGEILRLAKQWS